MRLLFRAAYWAPFNWKQLACNFNLVIIMFHITIAACFTGNMPFIYIVYGVITKGQWIYLHRGPLLIVVGQSLTRRWNCRIDIRITFLEFAVCTPIYLIIVLEMS